MKYKSFGVIKGVKIIAITDAIKGEKTWCSIGHLVPIKLTRIKYFTRQSINEDVK
jgi:hypothetical protein